MTTLNEGLSILGDKLSEAKSTTFARKLLFCISASLVMLLCLSMTFVKCQMYLSIAIMTLLAFSVGLGSFVSLEPNAVDLSPK